MKNNEISFVIRIVATAVLLLASVMVEDLHLSHLFTGMSIFVGVSIFKLNLSPNKKDDNYEEAK